MRKLFGVVYIIIGAGIIGLWMMLLGTDQVPELETAKAEIIMHIIIEITMGLMALLTSFLMLKKSKLFKEVCLLTNGLLIYSVVNSSGYYMRSGDDVFVLMFAMILIFCIYSTYIITLTKKLN